VTGGDERLLNVYAADKLEVGGIAFTATRTTTSGLDAFAAMHGGALAGARAHECAACALVNRGVDPGCLGVLTP